MSVGLVALLRSARPCSPLPPALLLRLVLRPPRSRRRLVIAVLLSFSNLFGSSYSPFAALHYYGASRQLLLLRSFRLSPSTDYALATSSAMLATLRRYPLVVPPVLCYVGRAQDATLHRAYALLCYVR